jgi:hypothetical protein
MLLWIGCCVGVTALAQAPVSGEPVNAGSLVAQFQHPPDEARPWVYWFWLNGNITRHGITADLEAMQRVGIGGVLIMEVDQGAPVGSVDFLSRDWRDLFQHVHHEARRLGLEVNMNNDAGWNGSGGPWIAPAQSMQKVVWSEVDVEGPGQFEGDLPQPEAVAGYYRDICVLAVPKVGDYRIDRIRAKALFEVGGVGDIARGDLPPDMRIEHEKIALVADQPDPAGRASWPIPAGRWTILRFGHTSTGVENAPAPASGRGLECDKLSPEGIEANFAGMMAHLAADTQIGPTPGVTGLVATHIDSWENGAQNWTAAMREEFQRRRGYDLLTFLPVLTGRVVDSREISERFLWDLRQTVSELVVENYAGRMRELAHAHGLRFTVEAYGSPCDALPYAGRSDEPMGEFWTPSGAIETCKTMASAAHVYGNKIVGAEAFTSGDQERWREHPALLKALGDRVFCEGVNRFVFHRYALQPWAERRVPGMTMGPWGQHYERTQTWWDWSADWHSYLARCQHLLRQGLFVADICYVQPEAPPQGPRDYPRKGYAWDECPAEVVLTRMQVSQGRIVLPDGMNYRLLVLPSQSTMTPQLLRKIRELVQAGATVLGPRPVMSPSLREYPRCDQEIEQLGAELWGDCDGHQVKQHAYGQGRVVWGLTPEEVLQEAGVPPDFVSGHPVHHIHRRTDDHELYFVASPHPYAVTTTCSFRVTGRTPEFWWPESGRTEPAWMYREEGGVTHVSVPFSPAGSVFVVFPTQPTSRDPVIELTRDQQRLLAAAPAPPVKVVVTQARYGVLDDSKRTRDVRDTIQRRVDAGEYRIAVSTLARGDDPAQGVIKSLTVDYTIDGKSYQVQGRDPDIVRLWAEAVRVKVERAQYGVLGDPQRTRDVREKIQRLADAGESSFVVARMAEGDDPAFLVVKTLDLEYTLDGQRRHITATDPELVYLAPPVTLPPPVATIRTNPQGVPMLEVREPGAYAWRTLSGRQRDVVVEQIPEPVDVPGPWQLEFPPGAGAPRRITLDRLMSWSEHDDPGVKYFSGVATYSNTITVPPELLSSGNRVHLDLGTVHALARVAVNGHTPVMLWKPPFQVDLTGIVQPGDNPLRVEVVNLWPNRMIGDELLPEDSQRHPNGTLVEWPQWLLDGQESPTGRHTFTSWRLWKKDDPLLPSGLIGPVTLQITRCIALGGDQEK